MTPEQKYLTCKEFTSLCGITKNTLVWYEKKGLISPKMVGENGYHYYGKEQFYEIDLIKSLKWVDKSLDECKSYMEHRSEDTYLPMLLEQQRVLGEKITALSGQKSIVDQTIQDYLSMKSRYSEEPKIVAMPERYFLSEPIENNTSRGYMKSLNRLFETFHNCLPIYKVAPSMLNAAIICQSDLLTENYQKLSYVCLKIASQIPIKMCLTIPKGEFALCFHKGKVEEISGTYATLTAFIQSKGLEVAGDAIESDFLNYLVTDNPELYAKEILIPVRPKEK